MKRSIIFAVTGAVLALLFLPGIAHAGPQVISSSPEQGATVHKPPAEATITFDLVLDPEMSELVILDECGNRVDGDDLRIEANQLTISIAKTPSGYYDMVYNAAAPAGVTGSTKGRITFLVHGGASCGPGAGDHSGHGGNDGHEDPGDGGGHDGHGDPGDGGGDDGGHDGHNDGAGAHDGDRPSMHASGDHDSTEHSTHTTEGSSHENKSGGQKQDRTSGKSSKKNPTAAPPIAAPEVLSFNLTHVSGGSLLLALFLCLALGVGGGYLIRQRGIL